MSIKRLDGTRVTKAGPTWLTVDYTRFEMLHAYQSIMLLPRQWCVDALETKLEGNQACSYRLLSPPSEGDCDERCSPYIFVRQLQLMRSIGL